MTTYNKKELNLIKKKKNIIFSEKGYYECKHCKRTDKFYYDLHHIIYRSEKPKHEQLHNDRNLILLCRECHNLFHKNKSIRNKLIDERKLNILFNDEGLKRW